MKLLVVEDEAVQAKVLTSRLSAEGLDVALARDGVHAVATVRREQPHLILLDIGLPGGDGYVPLRRLKAPTPHSLLPVIVVSARTAEAERQKILSLGVDGNFEKPVNLAGLVECINELLHFRQ